MCVYDCGIATALVRGKANVRPFECHSMYQNEAATLW